MCALRKYSQFLLPQQAKIVFTALTFCLLINSLHLYAIENNGRGTRAIGMGNAFVAISDNPWAINYNPAGLMQISNFQFSAFMIPEQFGLPELRTTAFAVALPLSFTTIGLKIEKFGFELFSESELGVGAAVKLDKNVSLGLNLNYRRTDIVHYGSAQNIILNGGALAQVFDNVATGFSFHNITRTKIGKSNEKLPQVFAIGTCWKPISTLRLSVEIEKDVRYPANIKAGVEQIIFDTFVIFGGIANNPDKYSTGFAINYSYFEFSYAGYSHIDLGWTHQIELSFKLDE